MELVDLQCKYTPDIFCWNSLKKPIPTGLLSTEQPCRRNSCHKTKLSQRAWKKRLQGSLLRRNVSSFVELGRKESERNTLFSGLKLVVILKERFYGGPKSKNQKYFYYWRKPKNDDLVSLKLFYKCNRVSGRVAPKLISSQPEVHFPLIGTDRLLVQSWHSKGP